jgi:cysteine desulfurase
MKRIYLDYAATTPVDPAVFKETENIFLQDGDFFGNPGSLHYFGQKAQGLLDDARKTLAETITANYREVIFTSSATEANNLILRGVLKAYYKKYKGCKTVPKFIISSIEHPSVLETVRALENEGAIKAAYLPVNSDGLVDLEALKKELNEETILVSIMWVNNETGVVQPIAEIAGIISEYKKSSANPLSLTPYPLFHADAVQAFNLFDLNVIKSGVDLMTLSSHKIYGPKGAGALYINSKYEIRNTKYEILSPILTGGGQEYGLRSGTENVPAIVGFAKAAEIAHQAHSKEFIRLEKLSKLFFEKIKKEIPDVQINGNLDRRSPNILSIYFPRHENLGVALDMVGVAASAGSACAQRYEKPSYVLAAMGMDESRIKQSIRFSFGRFTDENEILEASGRIVKVILKA